MRFNRDDYRLFIGADPALQGDYFGVCIHMLEYNRPESGVWIPKLLRVFKMQAPNYATMWKALNAGILSDYSHFYKLQIDYTNEKTMADFLEEKFGESRIVKTPFTKGESGTKMQLAQNALKMLKSGYRFPNYTAIKDPVESNNIKQLEIQIMNEEIKLNPDGSISFKHKGEHNDLLHAWMLSLDECAKYMMLAQGDEFGILGGPLSRKRFRSFNAEAWLKPEDITSMSGRLSHG